MIKIGNGSDLGLYDLYSKIKIIFSFEQHVPNYCWVLLYFMSQMTHNRYPECV